MSWIRKILDKLLSRKVILRGHEPRYQKRRLNFFE